MIAGRTSIMFTDPPDAVKWQVYECREAVPEPLYQDDADDGYGLCNDPSRR